MLSELKFSDRDFYKNLNRLLKRNIESKHGVDDVVRKIIATVRQLGDAAIIDYTRKFDRLDVAAFTDLELGADLVQEHRNRVDDELVQALSTAAQRIRRFHQNEKIVSWSFTEQDGTRLGQQVYPMDRVGVYVPGGKAAYPSSVLMTTIPAKVAGVGEIIMTVPTPDGEINSAVVVAAQIAGVDRIFTIGGAQAIAALAYGTQSVPRVDKIVGPGNIYVSTAKKQLFGEVGIDMIAGPSEVVVICDDSADPDWVVMDLFAQAEHDELAQSIAITTSVTMQRKLRASVQRLLPDMTRKEIITRSLTDHGAIIMVDSMQQAAEVSNHIGPEHLELMVENEAGIIDNIRHAGAIFIGEYSAEALGDYCAGPNHVLPTSGTAKFSSPLGVYDFQKRSNIIQVTAEGARELSKTAAILAHCEGLNAHEMAARYRGRDPRTTPVDDA